MAKKIRWVVLDSKGIFQYDVAEHVIDPDVSVRDNVVKALLEWDTFGEEYDAIVISGDDDEE